VNLEKGKEMKRIAGFLAMVVSAALGAVPGKADASGETVLVAGATGRTGKHVVEQLLTRDYRVRALVRDAAKARAELPSGVEIVTADVRDPKTLEAPMKGAMYVISAIGASGRGGDPANGPRQVDFEGVRNLAQTANAAGVKHLVLVSSAATSKAATYPVEFMRPILAAKFEGEQALRGSGVPYTVVKPGGLLDEPGGAKEVSFAQGDETPGRIPRADVAAVCVAVLGRESAMGKTFEIFSGAGGSNAAEWASVVAGLAADAK
jgi:uncharacterized protein YbjT (DUF2867 family)